LVNRVRRWQWDILAVDPGDHPVTKVSPVKAAMPPKVLPHTGAGLPLGRLATTAAGIVGIGLLLLAAGPPPQR